MGSCVRLKYLRFEVFDLYGVTSRALTAERASHL